jgi:hypothetical protein
MPKPEPFRPGIKCCQEPLTFQKPEASYWQKYVPGLSSCRKCGTNYELSPGNHLFRLTLNDYPICADTGEDLLYAIVETIPEPGFIFLEYYPYCRTHEQRPENSVDYNPLYETKRLMDFLVESYFEQRRIYLGMAGSMFNPGRYH